MTQIEQPTILDDEIIETMRMESVVKIIKKLVKETDISSEWINKIFWVIYQENAMRFKIRPENLLYDSKRVNETLEKIRSAIEKEKEKDNRGEPVFQESYLDHEELGEKDPHTSDDDKEILKMFRDHNVSDQ